ncbi:hypothetical protein [Microbispora bryophytorum]|uniref:hypothetical protein n=1 Tax=Microbispora bryophytorum TaxID=1460882 RepID=UPI00371ABFF1
MSVAAFIASQKTEHDIPHALACRALGVSQAWFYKWRGRAPTARQRRQADLDAAIEIRFAASAGTTDLRASRGTCTRKGGGYRSTRWRRGWPNWAWSPMSVANPEA